ncbi:4'-phosphopantetheinyl transferase family protein [Solimonas soli]|uniref:4'-phosphopantetheinyl transferase family protein n=1 Tax=Solimonas soli TaxID=413479 RepID=UPI0012FC645A|nr:4'-phosphopantetheinyl transferase superfamily protein [Solimonas soli]
MDADGAAAPERFDGAMPALVRHSSLLAALFDAGVAVAEYRARGDAAWLLPSEVRQLGAVSAKRLAEFAAGRACARLALQQLGLPRVALPPLADRCPAWPSTVVGSISHTTGFCVAAVAPRRRYRSIGIDVERIDDVEPGIWSHLLTPAEMQALQALPAARRQRFAALAFSAKEAFYKAQYTLTRQWLEFHDVEIDSVEPIDDARGHLRLRARRALPGVPSCWPARYLVHERWLFTGVALSV